MEADNRTFWIGLGGVLFGVAGGAVISLLLYLWPNMPRSIGVALLCFFVVMMGSGAVMIFAPESARRLFLKHIRHGMHWTHYFVALSGAAFCFSLILMTVYAEPRGSYYGEKNKHFTMLDLFMADIKIAMKNGNDVNSALHADTFFTVPNHNDPIHVYYAVIMHINQNTKYLSFYIPPTELSYEILKALPSNYLRLMNDVENNSVGFGGPDFQGVVRPSDLKFSGRIFVYSSTPLTLQQLAEVDRLFTASGANLRYRDESYSISFLEAVAKGSFPKPDHYEINANGIPEKAN